MYLNKTARRLTELREKYGYSKTQIAQIMNVAPSLISAYEKGERTPSLPKLMFLADLYHCSCDYLLGRELINSQEYIVNICELSPENQKLVRDLVDALKNNKTNL